MTLLGESEVILSLVASVDEIDGDIIESSAKVLRPMAL
jgi:hypothetical protein